MAHEPRMIGFENAAAMADRLADFIEAQLARAVFEHGEAALAVSGGSTPAALYQALSQRSLDWARIKVALVDERWVPPQGEGSNEHFVKETLLRGNAAEASFFGLWRQAPSPGAAAAGVCAEFNDHIKNLDVVVLGMGNDGHTASWFPHAEGLDHALSSKGPVSAITAKPSDVTGAHLQRMTMTLPAIAEARALCLLMKGEEKRVTFQKALKGGVDQEMPVRAILNRRPDLWACWAP